MDLTILIPVKNEENNIDSIVGEIKSNILINHEIVFINDFCTDNTCLKIKSLQKLHSNILNCIMLTLFLHYITLNACFKIYSVLP